MLRGDRSEYNRRAMMLAFSVGLVAVVLQIVTGDLSARFVADKQPEKFAAMEGQFETETGAPLRIGGWPDPDSGETRWAIEIPKAGSFLAFRDFDAEVRGLDAFPQDETPDSRLVHTSFQVMVASGFFMLFVAAWFLAAAARRRSVDPGTWLLRAMLVASPLGFVAIEAGWFVTEFGRQPWIIYHLMLTSEAATPRDGIAWLLMLFFLVYIALAAGLVMLLFRWRPRMFATGKEAPGVA
jgi:cytochrome d ubiquinol oxidase subunit I